MARSYADIGGALSNYASAMSRGYQAKKDMEARQQQLDFQTPKTINLPAQFISPVMNSPQLTYGGALEDASRIQGAYDKKTIVLDVNGNYTELQKDAAGNIVPVKLPPVRSGYLDPTMYEQNPQAPYFPDQTRRPAGEYDNKQQEAQIQNRGYRPNVSFQDQDPRVLDLRMRQAQAFGGSYDPQTGSFTLPGRVGVALLEQLQPKIIGDVSDIYKGARSAPAPTIVQQQQPYNNAGRGRGSTKPPVNPMIAIWQDEYKKLVASETKPDIKAKLLEMGMTPDQINARKAELGALISGAGVAAGAAMTGVPQQRQLPPAAPKSTVNQGGVGGVMTEQQAAEMQKQGKGQLGRRKNGSRVFRDSSGKFFDVK